MVGPGNAEDSNGAEHPQLLAEVRAPTVPIPAGNQALLKYVTPKVDADPNTDRPGCLYTGATRIKFVGNQMKVFSPNTKAASTPPRCLDIANRGNEQTKAIPPVIYVKPTTGTLHLRRVPADHRRQRRDDQHPDDELPPCRGTVYVEGDVTGQVTVSGEDDIVVTANLTVTDRTNTDVIGLVAGNYVWVYHPVKCTSSELLAARCSAPPPGSRTSTRRSCRCGTASWCRTGTSAPTWLIFTSG